MGLALAAAAVAALSSSPAQAWEPTAPVELVVPAGTGGGADQMARFIQELVAKHKLMGQPINVVNRPGNSGLEGLLEMKSARGNPHKLVITLSNLFTAPLATGSNFSWTDLSPVQMLALDQFVLWVVASSPYKTTPELLNALRSAPAGSLKKEISRSAFSLLMGLLNSDTAQSWIIHVSGSAYVAGSRWEVGKR